ncbi:MAG: UDP-N-acetylmuramoyl-L-alanyl-D-glutamate--2,6-diaminopimelate ligase [Woeseiaceae bacterium]
MSMPAEYMTAVPTLADLLQGYADAPGIPVQGIASDSRLLRDGFLFLAVQGMSSHGLDYIEQARQAGVCALAWDAATGTDPGEIGIPTIAIDDLAGKLGEIANRYYGRPSEQLNVIGVTGTNGKTTVAWMIAQAREILGERCAYLGTLGYGVDAVEGAAGMTTPAAIELHGHLADFVSAGATSAALEVSSHALAQGRVDGVRFDAALFTNLTRDHLDYHADMREYFESKARLFLECDPTDRIIDIDTEYGAELAAKCGPEVVTVSTRPDRVSNERPFVFVRSVVATAEGSDIAFASTWGDGQFTSQLPGDFNVANAILVLALLLKKGVPLDVACDVMSQLSAPPGRMQRVAMDGPAAVIDYAHTPDALEVALRALRAHCRGKLWCVFGCGGDRDKGKRPQMGEVAEQYSDCVVITTDNPRSEDPRLIIGDILAGLRCADRATIIEDRAAAIAWTISQADDQDVVLIAGKGHEDYQESNGERIAFSDYAVAQKALAASVSAQ